MSIRSYLVSLSTVLVPLALLAPSVARAQLAPTGGHYAMRSTDTGHDPVGPNASGGFTASLPLDLPSARGGLPIPLQVVSGTRGFGAAGVGWDVPLSYVLVDRSFAHRRPAYTPGQPATPRERITVDLPGRHVDMIVVGTDGTNWVGRNDPDVSMTYDSGDSTYRVYDGRGLTYVFTHDQRLDGTGGPSPGGGLWLLDSIVGAGGSTVKLTTNVNVVYLADSAPAITLDLGRIQYNNHPSITHCYKTEITLGYDGDVVGAGPSASTILGSVLIVRQHKLNYIDVSSRATCADTNPQLIRRYALTYATDPDTSLPRLASAAVFGRGGTGVSLPIAAYQYGSATVADGSGGRALQEQKMDWTIRLPDGVAYIASTQQVDSSQFEAPYGSTSYASQLSFTDFTGDGRPDLIFPQNGQLMIARNIAASNGATTLATPVPFTDSVMTKQVLDARSSTHPRFGAAPLEQGVQEYVWREAIDVNGDGRVDIIDASESPGHWIVYLNKPSPGPSGITWVRRAYDITRIHEALFREAGLVVPDSYLPLSKRSSGSDHQIVMCFKWGSGGTGAHYAATDNSDCGPNSGAGDVPWQNAEKTYTEWNLTDVNGDGYPDLIFNGSPVMFTTSEPPPTYEGDYIAEPINYWLKLEGSTHVKVAYNVAGVFINNTESDAKDPFSASQDLGATAGCGVELWRGQTVSGQDGQALVCAFADVNGDGLLDRIEDDASLPEDPNIGTESQRVQLGTGSGFVHADFVLPYYASAQHSGYVGGCPNAPGFTSFQSSGIRDLTGDGIPEFLAPLSGRSASIGTGAGFATSSVSGGGYLSTEDESCFGTSATTNGYFDVDGDGKPEWVHLHMWSHDTTQNPPKDEFELEVYKLVGSGGVGALDAGRIVGVDNGAGALTMVTYRSAKEDSTTAHQVPFAEIVVDHTQTIDMHLFGGRLAKKTFAYGNISMFYDSQLGAFRPTGYLRTVAITTTASHGGSSKAPGSAQIIDHYAPEMNMALDGTGRFMRYARTGRVSDVTVLAVADNADPWPLLIDVLPSDLRRAAGSHSDVNAQVVPERWDLAIDCLDIMDPFDFETSQAYNLGFAYRPCYAHGFVYTSGASSWHGSSAPPSSGNVEMRWSVTNVDDLGRPTSIFDERDAHVLDDDLCVEIKYAKPAMDGFHVPSAVASRTVSGCGKTGNVVYKAETFLYDDLPQGLITQGLPTSHSTHIYTADTGSDLGIIHDYDVAYNAAGNPVSAMMHRDSDGAERTTTITYDEFGLAPVHISVKGTGVAQLDVDNSIDAVTGELIGSIDANGTKRGTIFDGFGRPVYETIQKPGEAAGVLKAWDYTAFDSPDAYGRRVVVKSFSDPVDKNDVQSSPGRRATTYIDELARPRRTEVDLGDDYANAVMVVGQRSYDDLGRVVFEADPYPTSQASATAYGTTRYFNQDGSLDVQIRGPGVQAYATTVDEASERYPTLARYSFDNYQETTIMQTADALASLSPQTGVQRQSATTATGRVVSRATWQGATRLEYEQLSYDHLGQLASLTRYQDPSTPANPVTTSFQLDSQGRVVTLTEPSNPPQKRTYDDWGELTQIERAPQSEPAHDIRYEYDAYGRLIHSAEYNDNTIDAKTNYKYGYDIALTSPIVDNKYTLGRMTNATGPSGEVRFGYDALGHMTASTFIDADDSVYVEQSARHADGSIDWIELDLPDSEYTPERMYYQNDSAGRLRWMWYDDENNVEDIYDAEDVDVWGRPRQVNFGFGGTVTASYSDTGRRLPKSVKVNYGTESRSFDYGAVDAVGRELKRTSSLPSFAGVETSSYDALGRLFKTTRTQGSTSTSQWDFSYDALGNVTSLHDQIGSADAALSYVTSAPDRDRICRIGYGNGGLGGTACNVEYDSFGNVVTEPTRTGTNVFKYFSSGLVQVISNSAGVSATFSYDPFGHPSVVNVGQFGNTIREDRHFGTLITKRKQQVGANSSDYILRRFPAPGFVVSRRGWVDSWIYEFSESRGLRFTAHPGNGWVSVETA